METIARGPRYVHGEGTKLIGCSVVGRFFVCTPSSFLNSFLFLHLPLPLPLSLPQLPRLLLPWHSFVFHDSKDPQHKRVRGGGGEILHDLQVGVSKEAPPRQSWWARDGCSREQQRTAQS
jgi:hypothetical protein